MVADAGLAPASGVTANIAPMLIDGVADFATPTSLPAEAAAIVQAYQRASKADVTVRAYTADARVFQEWCARYGFQSLLAPN